MMHSKTSKTKISGEILLKQNDLMSKLSLAEQPLRQSDELGFPTTHHYIQNQPDSLTILMNKAKTITSGNQDKIQKAKRQIKMSKKQGTFLTGVGVYTQQIPNTNQQQYEDNNIDHHQMLKDLIKKDCDDDLQQLRRMIKQTGDNLSDYGKQVYKSRNQILNAADRFNRQMSTNLSHKLHTIQIQQKVNKKKKKFSSTSSIKPKRYDNFLN